MGENVLKLIEQPGFLKWNIQQHKNACGIRARNRDEIHEHGAVREENNKSQCRRDCTIPIEEKQRVKKKQREKVGGGAGKNNGDPLP